MKVESVSQKSHLESINVELNAAKTQLESFKESSAGDKLKAEKLMKETEKQITELQNEKMRLEKKIESKESALKEALKSKDLMKDTCEGLLKELEASRGSADAETNLLREETSSLRERLQNSELKMLEVLEKLQMMKKNEEATNKQLASSKSDLYSANEELLQLQSDICKSSEREKELCQEVGVLQASVTYLKQEVERSSNENKKLEDRFVVCF